MSRPVRSISVPGLFLVFVLPFLVIVFFFISEIQRSVSFAENESDGVAYSRAVRKFMESAQRFRAVSSHPGEAARVEEARAAIEAGIAGVDAVDRKLGARLRSSDRWLAVKNRWHDAQRAAPGASAKTAQDALIADAIALVNHVGDMSNLILDPDLDTYYLMDATVTKLLPVTERIEQMRLLALNAAVRQTSDPEDRNQTITNVTAIQDGMAAVERGMKVAFEANPTLRDELTAQNAASVAVKEFLETVQAKLKVAPVEEVTQSVAPPITACFALHDTMTMALDRLLAARIARFRSKMLAVGGFALLALVTAAYVFWSFGRGQRARLQAEQELRESELRKGAILQSALDCIITMDLEGKIIEFNPAAEKTFGYRRDEVIGKELASVMVPPALREMHRSALQKYRETGEGLVLGQRIEIPALHADGHEFMAELATAPIKTAKATVFTIFLRDISERRRAAEDLRLAKEAAEAANLAKRDFLANMSHEIRTPMNGVIGVLDLLQGSNLNPRQRELAKIAQSSADSLLTIINDILDYSKIEAGKLVIEPVPFDLQTVVEEVAEIHAARIEEKALDLIVRYEPSAPRRVVGDSGRIRQVLSNLVSNAVKFTERGHVLINVEALEQNATQAKLKLSIEDTGIGIPADKLPLLFNKFTQADASTTRRFGGTGLGLAISKHLVEAMGGQIDAVSFPGRGSVFSCTLPLPLHDRSLPETQPKVSQRLAGVRVFVVDDNEVNRRVLDEQLKSWGMRNGGSAEPRGVVAQLRRALEAGDPYRIVILDYQMPGMTGEDLAFAIQAEPDLRDTVLIMLTSMGYDNKPANLQAAGISACLVKPVRQSQLMDALAAAWAGQIVAAQPRREPRPSGPSRPANASRAHLHVLVVDDNATNQKVASLMLGELNCRVDLAANGREAIEMYGLVPYDVVFMDCEMPDMDGFEAVAAIRKAEAGRRHVPIVAMTAKAMQGDRDRCLAAGMDDYLSKPVMMEELERILDQHQARAGAAKDPPSRAVLDEEAFARLLRIGQNDQAQLREVIDTFFQDAAGRLASMRQGLSAGDGARIAFAAHGIRGGALTLGAGAVAELGEQIETLCRPGSVEGAAPLIERIADELDALRLEVAARLTAAPTI